MQNRSKFCFAGFLDGLRGLALAANDDVLAVRLALADMLRHRLTVASSAATRPA